jgi:amidase
VLRALSFASGLKTLYETHRDKLKPDVVWNIEKGLALTGAEIARAEMQRGVMFRRAREFFTRYDLILCPATIVGPFPVEQRYVDECNGHKFSTYIDWLAIVYAFTNVASPAISIPAGFTREGLPVGIQIAAPCRGEARLLAAAKLLEELLDLGPITPLDPRPGK